jgi:hypothetical protein
VVVASLVAAAGMLLLRTWARWLHVAAAVAGHVALLAAWPELLLRDDLGSRFGPYGWVLAGMACAACGLAASALSIVLLLQPAVAGAFLRRSSGTTVAPVHPLATASAFLALLPAFAFAASFDPMTEAARGLKIDAVEQLHDAGRSLMRHRDRTGRYPRDEAEAARAGVPGIDPWGRPLRYAAWSQDSVPDAPDAYVLASAGSDGLWEATEPRATIRDAPAFPSTADRGEDIVLHDGAVIRYPFLGG